MAYINSGEINPEDKYVLGKYEFDISKMYDSGRNVTSVIARCGDIGAASKPFGFKLVSGEADIVNWYVEANDTTADVYALLEKHPPDPPDVSPWTLPIKLSDAIDIITQGNYHYKYEFDGVAAIALTPDNIEVMFFASSSSDGSYTRYWEDGGQWVRTGTSSYTNSYTYDGKTVYYMNPGGLRVSELISGDPNYIPSPAGSGEVAWMMVYGSSIDPSSTAEMPMIARFNIDLEEAGGKGEDSDWDDPDDYDYDDYPKGSSRDPDDPTYTLNLEVDGALSGRHNDPLNDTSYSYVPYDKETLKQGGYGGDGGHGGGGGGGASTVIIYKFSTSRADSKEIIAKALRHGYGSGGGKGGKGGDGCILIYY